MNESQDLVAIAQRRQNRIFLLFIIAICILVTLYVNVVMGIDVVYTHLFYIPIILAGIWYHRKAIYLAIFLGLAHISIGYYLAGYIVPSTLVRAAIFIIVAFVVGYLSEKRDKLYSNVRLLLESTDEGIVGVDVEDRCTFINKSALKTLGYSLNEVKGHNMHDLIRHSKPDGRPCTKEECCVVQSLSTGTGCRDSGDIFWKKDGTPFPVEYSSYPIIENGEITGAVVTFVDITERKKAEDEIRDARKQAELYVDLMGHDINNMNQTGISYLELALEKLKLSGEDRVYLEKPLEALYNSSRLIDTVRKLQMVKEKAVKHEKVDMCQMLQEVISHYSHVPGRDVKVNYKPGHGCYVMADELLKDVFSNIIGNAIKHSTGPVTIDIELNTVLEDNKKYYRVDISDNGPGIPDELKKMLFGRSQRGTAKTTGRGLGLYLVKNLVDDFQGKVWVEDRVPGDYTKGSRFVVMLPALTSSPPSPGPAR
jgi:PAS domain S-box-containing protein